MAVTVTSNMPDIAHPLQHHALYSLALCCYCLLQIAYDCYLMQCFLLVHSIAMHCIASPCIATFFTSIALCTLHCTVHFANFLALHCNSIVFPIVLFCTMKITRARIDSTVHPQYPPSFPTILRKYLRKVLGLNFFFVNLFANICAHFWVRNI